LKPIEGQRTVAPAPIPVFITGSAPRLPAFYFPPDASQAPRGDILFVPSFAEEMNRCRAMACLQAQALTGLGHGVLVMDLFGTGDAPGEFEQADVDAWMTDLAAGVQWLRERARGCRTVWGVRLGALLAAKLAQQDAGIDRLLLWQPVVSGKTFWTQFLRIRIASEMGQADGVKTTDALRQMSARGEAVEASGYHVGSRLATQLDALQMPGGAALGQRAVHWFEVLANEASVVPPVNLGVVDKMRAAGVAAQLVSVVGPAFWHVHERDVAPALIEATVAAVRAWADDGSVDSNPVQPPASNIPGDAAERPIAFPCGDAWLSGAIHRGKPQSSRGVVIVVAGGPQYRAGAHRQFVSLARLLAANGYPVLRFDLRGMGDSSGQYLGYEKSIPDIRAAIDALQAAEPSVSEVVCFGECESASGILFYAHRDPRVVGAALANPWGRAQKGQAEVILKHYYRDRLLSKEFWGNVVRGQYRVGQSLTSFAQVVLTFLKGRKALRAGASTSDDLDRLPLPARTAEGLRRFKGRVLVLMSGRDYIAREFDEVTKSSEAWRGLLDQPRVTRVDIADADHTFSKPEAKAQAQKTLLDWLAEA
jgi:exosortase A-associated hydrolase 1/exosortase A-associated hydrolase 2